MGCAFNEDERPTSNIQRPTSNEKTNFQYRTLLNSDSSEKLSFQGNPKSKIATPTGKLGGWEAGRPESWELGVGWVERCPG
jgi:hypothetical protein